MQPTGAQDHPLENGRVPDFFIVGHHKCGTTALYEMLRLHPQIWMPDQKEPNFLAGDFIVEPVVVGPSTMDAYLDLFVDAAADQVVGEASPIYLMSNVAAESIAEINPNARIIALFREPASYLRSFHLQMLQALVENEPDLQQALDLEPKRREDWHAAPNIATNSQLLWYSEHLHYTDQLRRFHKVFPTEQVLVLFHDEFRADNKGTLDEVQRFLGINPSSELPMVESNPATRVNQRGYRAVARFARGQGRVAPQVKKVAQATVPKGIRRFVIRTMFRTVTRPAEPVDPEMLAKLRPSFKPEVERFGEYVGRDLVTQWDYQDV